MMNKYRIKEYTDIDGDRVFIAEKRGLFGWHRVPGTFAMYYPRCREKLCKKLKNKKESPKYHEVDCGD